MWHISNEGSVRGFVAFIRNYWNFVCYTGFQLSFNFLHWFNLCSFELYINAVKPPYLKKKNDDIFFCCSIHNAPAESATPSLCGQICIRRWFSIYWDLLHSEQAELRMLTISMTAIISHWPTAKRRWQMKKNRKSRRSVHRTLF